MLFASSFSCSIWTLRIVRWLLFQAASVGFSSLRSGCWQSRAIWMVQESWLLLSHLFLQHGRHLLAHCCPFQLMILSFLPPARSLTPSHSQMASAGNLWPPCSTSSPSSWSSLSYTATLCCWRETYLNLWWHHFHFWSIAFWFLSSSRRWLRGSRVRPPPLCCILGLGIHLIGSWSSHEADAENASAASYHIQWSAIGPNSCQISSTHIGQDSYSEEGYPPLVKDCLMQPLQHWKNTENNSWFNSISNYLYLPSASPDRWSSHWATQIICTSRNGQT